MFRTAITGEDGWLPLAATNYNILSLQDRLAMPMDVFQPVLVQWRHLIGMFLSGLNLSSLLERLVITMGAIFPVLQGTYTHFNRRSALRSESPSSPKMISSSKGNLQRCLRLLDNSSLDSVSDTSCNLCLHIWLELNRMRI
jgi:hypothetical protein